jgi:hypothetical protein
VTGLAASPDARSFLSVGLGGVWVREINANRGQVSRLYPAPPLVFGIAARPDNASYLTSQLRQVYSLDLATGELKAIRGSTALPLA